VGLIEHELPRTCIRSEDEQSLKPIVATWIVQDSDEEASFYPQTGMKSSASPRVYEMYWRCVACFFATAFRVTGNTYRFVLYTSVESIPARLQGVLEDCGVHVEQLSSKHLPPKGYFGQWRNQFYILDIIQHMTARDRIADCLVLDSDCLFVSSIETLFERVVTEGVLTYNVGLPADEIINGLTRIQMRDLFGSLRGKSLATPPQYFGGEIFTANASALLRFNAEIEPLWNECLHRASRGEAKLNEEAHFLSYLYLKFCYKDGTANDFIKRIWTQRRYRTGTESDLMLPIWHVPAEKRFGFRDLYPRVLDRGSWFWSLPVDHTWKSHIASLMGIPSPAMGKMTKDLVRSVWGRLTKRA